MEKFHVLLSLPPEVEPVLGRGPMPDFIEQSSLPQRGDLLRFKGKNFVIQARLWDLDITPLTLVLKLETQETSSGSPKTPT